MDQVFLYVPGRGKLTNLMKIAKKRKIRNLKLAKQIAKKRHFSSIFK
jgi:hypothetical protein